MISCFDPRATPEDFFATGHRAREITSIRNAGGHTRHVVQDIVGYDAVLGIKDIIVIHHTDCGLTRITNEEIREKVKGYEKEEGGRAEYDVEGFDFGAMESSGLEERCRENVRFLREHPWVRQEINVVGFVYNIKTGLVEEV